MQRVEQLKLLLIMAATDGGLADEELSLLAERAGTWGIAPDEFQKVLTEVQNGDTAISAPESKEQRDALLMDLVRMMGADGKLEDQEKDLFAMVAAKLHVSDEELNAIIDATVNGDSTS